MEFNFVLGIMYIVSKKQTSSLQETDFKSVLEKKGELQANTDHK